jgi:hypothetical protein
MDTLDELGLGKDIRIIRYILDTLDSLNASGVPIKGTWDIENYYSLQKNMAALCPELIERIKNRVQSGVDEIQIMSYNNGILSAKTEEEALAAIECAISNPDGSGLKDIFGTFAPVVRPQECMMTPSLINVYKKAGIEAFSVYYSSISFNGFSNFVPLLPTVERFNPLWYTADGCDEKIALLPCINPADYYDLGGIRGLVKRLRKEQLAMQTPKDMLVIVDMDADDDFWQGYLNVHLSLGLGFKKPLVNGGLNIIAKKMAKIPYVEFATPYEYLKTHEPVGTVNFGQDLADGAYDGYSSWAEKLENTKLWTRYERAKLNAEYAKAVSGNDENLTKSIADNIPSRILTLSTTHFGLSTPAMGKPRLEFAFEKSGDELKKSEQWLDDAKKMAKPTGDARAVFARQYERGAGKRKGLIRLRADFPVAADGVLGSFEREVFGNKEINLIYEGNAKELNLTKNGAFLKTACVNFSSNSICNENLTLAIESNTLTLYRKGKKVSDNGSFETGVKYNGEIVRASDKVFSVTGDKNTATIEEKGKLKIGETKEAHYTKTYMLAGNLPYLYVDVDIRYPLTDDFGANKKKVKMLYRGYDTRWEEIYPLEYIPAFNGNSENPIKVTKHNFMGKLSSFNYDLYKYTKNENLASGNNAITCGFVAFGAKNEGILMAQSAAADNNFAFSRIRFNRQNNEDKIKINPFGLYRGNALLYNTARFPSIAKVAYKFAAAFLSQATTYRGGRQCFSLMLAPFENELTDDLINDAMMFAYPPYVYSADDSVKMVEFTPTDEIEVFDKI